MTKVFQSDFLPYDRYDRVPDAVDDGFHDVFGSFEAAVAELRADYGDEFRDGEPEWRVRNVGRGFCYSCERPTGILLVFESELR